MKWFPITIETARYRSGPKYLHDGGQVVSLVKEEVVRRVRLRWPLVVVLCRLRAAKVFVIDEEGVKSYRPGQWRKRRSTRARGSFR